MGFPRGNVPWAGFGAEPQYKSVGDTAESRFVLQRDIGQREQQARICLFLPEHPEKREQQ